jgi:hypothetical protein
MTKLQDATGGDLQDFGLRRLAETSLVNVSRIDIFWNSLMAHFQLLTQFKDQTVRVYTIEAIQLIVTEIFAHRKQIQN